MYWPKRVLHWRHLQCSLCVMAAAFGKSIGWATAFPWGNMDYCLLFPLCCLIFFYESSPDLCSRYLQIHVSTRECPYPLQTTANQLSLWGLFYLRRYKPNASWEKIYPWAFSDVSVCELRSLYFCQGPMTCLKHLHSFLIKLLFLPALIHRNIFLSWAITSQKRPVKRYFTAYSSFKCSSFK